jgi:hypothetical protein
MKNHEPDQCRSKKRAKSSTDKEKSTDATFSKAQVNQIAQAVTTMSKKKGDKKKSKSSGKRHKNDEGSESDESS